MSVQHENHAFAKAVYTEAVSKAPRLVKQVPYVMITPNDEGLFCTDNHRMFHICSSTGIGYSRLSKGSVVFTWQDHDADTVSVDLTTDTKLPGSLCCISDECMFYALKLNMNEEWDMARAYFEQHPSSALLESLLFSDYWLMMRLPGRGALIPVAPWSRLASFDGKIFLFMVAGHRTYPKTKPNDNIKTNETAAVVTFDKIKTDYEFHVTLCRDRNNHTYVVMGFRYLPKSHVRIPIIDHMPSYVLPIRFDPVTKTISWWRGHETCKYQYQYCYKEHHVDALVATDLPSDILRVIHLRL